MTIEELKQLHAQTEGAQMSAWEKYRAAQESIEPFKQEWLALYEKAKNLKTRISVMEEMAAEKEAA